jgi:hypothetical protein
MLSSVATERKHPGTGCSHRSRIGGSPFATSRSREDLSERIKAVIRARNAVPDSDAARERAELVARIVDGLLPLSAEQVSALRTLLGPIRPATRAAATAAVETEQQAA